MEQRKPGGPAPAGAPLVPGGTNYPALRRKEVIAAAEEYFAAKAEVKLLEGKLETLKRALLAAMAGAPVATAGARVLHCTVVPEIPASPSVTIDRSMLGQVIPGKRGRASYVQLVVQ